MSETLEYFDLDDPVDRQVAADFLADMGKQELSNVLRGAERRPYAMLKSRPERRGRCRDAIMNVGGQLNVKEARALAPDA